MPVFCLFTLCKGVLLLTLLLALTQLPRACTQTRLTSILVSTLTLLCTMPFAIKTYWELHGTSQLPLRHIMFLHPIQFCVHAKKRGVFLCTFAICAALSSIT